jgi:hypothetical protein
MGLIIGIGLVILQLQQNEKLLRFQIATDLRMNRHNDRNVTRGEQYSTTLAKLQTAPEGMTDAELVQFDAHARSLTSELFFRRLLAEEDILKGNWRNWLKAESCDLFNNRIGRAWLKIQGQAIDQEVIDELEQRLGECASLPSFLKSVREGQTQ